MAAATRMSSQLQESSSDQDMPGLTPSTDEEQELQGKAEHPQEDSSSPPTSDDDMDTWWAGIQDVISARGEVNQAITYGDAMSDKDDRRSQARLAGLHATATRCARQDYMHKMMSALGSTSFLQACDTQSHAALKKSYVQDVLGPKAAQGHRGKRQAEITQRRDLENKMADKDKMDDKDKMFWSKTEHSEQDAREYCDAHFTRGTAAWTKDYEMFIDLFVKRDNDERDNDELEFFNRCVQGRVQGCKSIKELVREQAAMKIRELKLRKEPSEKNESDVLKEAKR